METKNEIDLKIVFCGNTKVGKTSIIKRFTENQFNSNERRTVALDVKTNKIESKKYLKRLNISIWDTTGEEKYRAVCKKFIEAGDIIILVLNLFDKDSFLYLSEYKESFKDTIKPEAGKYYIRII